MLASRVVTALVTAFALSRKNRTYVHILVNELLLWMEDSASALECGEAIVIA